MVVMKFGGTSVMDAICIERVASLVCQSSEKEPTAVVLSAMKGTTDALLSAAQQAISHEHSSSQSKDMSSVQKIFQDIRLRHTDTWIELISTLSLSVNDHPLPKALQSLFDELEELLHGISLIKECTSRTQDLIVSFGERMSVCIFSEYLNVYRSGITGHFLDAREYIITNNKHGYADVKFELSYQLLRDKINTLCSELTNIPVITGFISATEDGITTTLGRNGSDYTAALVGAAVGASRIEIWTDVDGVLSADPRVAPQAFVLPQISYSEAMELSYFGAKVIHPQTVVPAIEQRVPIVIKNTMNPSAEGTIIEQDAYKHKFPITGLTSVHEVGMLTIEGAGLSGNFHFLPEVFTLLSKHQVHPLLITQSSSEHSICFVLHSKELFTMKKVLEETFSEELKFKRIQSITIIEDIAIISVIGSQMRGTRGLAGRIFNTMGKHEINVIAIAQGSNETNVSFVVEKQAEQQAIRVLHEEFFDKILESK